MYSCDVLNFLSSFVCLLLIMHGFFRVSSLRFFGLLHTALHLKDGFFITFFPIVNCIKQEKKIFLKRWSCFVVFFSLCTVQINWKEIKGKNKNQNIIWKYVILYSCNCKASFSIGTKQQQTYANFVLYCQHYSKRSKFINICCDLISSHNKC